ncbi:MAG: transporter substrate-binding domain-containing protein [Cyclobacteriaceae bacterium]
MASAKMRMKLCLLPLLVALACTPNDKVVENSEELPVSIDLADIRERGYLNALVDNNSMSYFYYRGGPMGYEYELLQRLTKELGVELRIKVITNIEEAVQMLNSGKGDIMAFPFTVTPERKEVVAFTETHFNTSQVLVQRRPDNWMDNPHIAEKKMLRNPVNLIGKEVYVKFGSSFKDRLKNLSQEIGGEIIIIEDSASSETESLIKKVAEGEIDYTVTDEMIGLVNAAYYDNLDVKTKVSFPQQIAWAVRKNSPTLLEEINTWIRKVKKDGTLNVIYNRYFNSPRTSARRRKSDYSSLGGNKLSVYDDVIRKKAAELDWDWRLLASMIYQESNFMPNVTSWAGARGLMQLMPSTGKYYGAVDLDDPIQSINAGVKFIKFLDRQWSKTIEDEDERVKFILASYNVGLSHVIDARNLARKYDGNPLKWEGEVESYLLKKSDPEYYRDPVVKAGYCRCEEPVKYVRQILYRFEEYKRYIN